MHFLSIDRFQRGDISQVKKLSLQHDDSQVFLFLTMFQISLQVASDFEKLLRQLPRTNLPCEKTSLQELPASNIALHAGVVGFDLFGGRCVVGLLLRVSHVAADPYTCDRCNMMQSFKLAFTNMFAHGLHARMVILFV